ncbi:hypothetical protein ACFL6C_03240 [Myxococcota bacterium]
MRQLLAATILLVPLATGAKGRPQHDLVLYVDRAAIGRVFSMLVDRPSSLVPKGGSGH